MDTMPPSAGPDAQAQAPKSAFNMQMALIILAVLLALFGALYVTILRPSSPSTEQAMNTPAGQPSLTPGSDAPAPVSLGSTLYDESNTSANTFAAATSTNPVADAYQNPFAN